MKVALLIAGYLRNYESGIDFIKKEIISKFGDVDIYLHITKFENIEDKYLNNIEETDVKKIVDLLNPVSTLIENNEIYVSDTLKNNVINLWAKLYKLNELKTIRENETSKYDLVIRYRLDLNIITKNIFDIDFDKNVIYLPKDTKIDKLKLINPNDKYLCDSFAFGSSKIMDKYFNMFPFYGNSMLSVSETALYEYLKKENIEFKQLNITYNFVLSKCNVFAICGDSGSGKSTLSSLLKKCFNNSFTLECDRYHKWERFDENWESITHLNPDANYITKMEEDIFNLKLGNEIYQVDYDHNTGKFTEKQLINPSDNLIVCGLHSLYGDNNLYDIRIFMDTDDNLKKKWKIKRDVIERGYTINKVLKSIEKRKNDFDEFIIPQKENANLIVRFFSINDIDFYDFENEEKLSLEISVSLKCKNLNYVLNLLDENNIKYTINETNNFTKITFYNYTELNKNIINLPKEIKTNTFYDYVLYFIFSIKFTL
jgi:uridine kinase